MAAPGNPPPPPQPPFRVGQGYDIHRFAPPSAGRPLVLGGVTFPGANGLEGHSDADCLTHAVADAVLGAAGLPDIGQAFPPGDPATAGIDSLIILRSAVEQAAAAGYEVGNVDATVIAQEPVIGPHVPAMKAALAEALGIDPTAVGVKATTHEGIGALGRAAGIAAHAVCLLVPTGDSGER